jgi:hypothetical protein
VTAAVETPLRFRLVVQKRGATWGRSALTGKRELVRDQERYKALPDTPPGFVEREGTYGEISHLAERANKGQLENWDGHGERLDYLFSPDLVPEEAGEPA